MQARLTFNAPIITAVHLIKKRWTGLPEHIFLQHLEEMSSVADINKGTPAGQFPHAFWLQGTREDLQTGSLETEYLPWEDECGRFTTAMRRYSEHARLPSILDEIFFKLSDVEVYEQDKAWLKHRLVDPDAAWEKKLVLEKDVSPIEALERELVETQENLVRSQRIKKKYKKRIEELEKELSDAKEGKSGVDSKKWARTIEAVFSLFIDVMQSNGVVWKKESFIDSLAERCHDYHTAVVASAWKALPKKFKLGSGKPKKPYHMK